MTTVQTSAPQGTPTTPTTPEAIAEQAFIYGLPLVLVELTKLKDTNYETAGSEGAPVNQLCNKLHFPTYEDTSVVRPNCDTYYSIAFFDLKHEPMVLTVPPTGDLYYMLPVLDAFTNIVPGSPGTRTDETTGGNYLITGPGYDPALQPDMPVFDGHLECPTNMAWLIGRFQVNDDNTPQSTAMSDLMGHLKLQPLGTFLADGDYAPPAGTLHQPIEGTPNDVVKAMSITDFFTLLNRLLVDNPPAPADADAMALFAQIGVGPQAEESFAELAPTFDMQRMNLIPRLTLDALKLASSDNSKAWSPLLGSFIADYGTQYFKRAMVAYVGLGANPCVDAVYYKTLVDGDLKHLIAPHRYTFTLAADNMPPVDAFWSLTLYDPQGYFIDASPNGIGHSVAKPLVPNADGSITIYIQAKAPEDSAYRNNWLPTPAEGRFNLIFRAYYPQEAIVDGTWMPPAVERVV